MNAPAELPDEIDAWADAALDALIARTFKQLRPRPPMTPLQWVERYRRLSPEENPDYAGAFNVDNIPALRGILAAAGQRGVRRIVVQKPAQIAWTAGVVCTVMGYFTHWRPSVQVALFPREKSAKDFDAEKFSPMVRATPALSRRIKLKSRSDGNSATRKHYPGGLLKFVASNSPADVKSTSAKVIYVEEPDDTNDDVKGQGDSITLLRERAKSIRETLEIIGGTPTAKGASKVEKEIRTTDRARFFVACHECGERHEPHHDHMVIPGLHLSPEELAAPDIDERYPKRDVYGRARPEDAYYACPHCGAVWTDEQRVANLRRAGREAPHYGWEASAQSNDRGFFLNEFMATFEGSYIPILADKYCKALHELDNGDPTKMIAYTNSTKGETWEYVGELPEEEELSKRAEDYAEWTVPAGGLVALLTVDVQHDRLAITCWVVGRGEEMWLAYWGELYGSTIVANQGAWLELETLLDKQIVVGGNLKIAITAVGIDCSDGQTSEASYAFVRKHHKPGRHVLALKGAADDEGRVEIWRPPKAIDPNHRSTKASRAGVQVHIVGTAKAKDLLLGWATQTGRVRVEGGGPGAMHWYQSVRADFYEQLLSEIKIPKRSNPKKRVWKHRTDRRNEALDCTVYAIYLVRHLRLHLRKAALWDVLENRLRQNALAFDTEPADVTDTPPSAPAAPPAPAPPPPTRPRAQTTALPPPRDNSFGHADWNL